MTSQIKRDKGTASPLVPFSGEVTLFMSDACGFGYPLEGVDPETLCQIMNKRFEGVHRSIQESGGQIVTSVGDAVLAYWGPSRTVPSHAELALNCGRTILTRLRQIESETNLPIYVRIVLATGKMNGSFMQGRFQVVGAPYATAKRLEILGTAKRSQMLYTSETLELASVQEFLAPIARVKGSSGEEVAVFEFTA